MTKKHVNRIAFSIWTITSFTGSLIIGVISYYKSREMDMAIPTFAFYLVLSLILSSHSYFIFRPVLRSQIRLKGLFYRTILITTAICLTIISFIPFFYCYLKLGARFKHDSQYIFWNTFPYYLIAAIITTLILGMSKEDNSVANTNVPFKQSVSKNKVKNR